MTKLPLILLAFITVNAFASFLPPGFELNEKALPEGQAQITEQEFRSRLEKLTNTYSPVFHQFGAVLKLNGDWSNDKLIAKSGQQGQEWSVDFSGGIARRPELSPDGMTLIICHELGHHVAGFPFYPGTIFKESWGSVEGQADYFSTFVCARKMWMSEPELNQTFRAQVDQIAKTKCDSVFESDADRDLCYRATVGAQSIIKTMVVLMNAKMPRFDTPDLSRTTGTMGPHPTIQCRLDTLLQGSLCRSHFDEALIPGKHSPGGHNGIEAEKEAAMNSCTALNHFSVGMRPACWFQARM